MQLLWIIFAAMAALIHVLFFWMESVSWMNPKTHGIFGVKNEKDAETLRLIYFNQGFYNLFLALGIFTGIVLSFNGCSTVGFAIILFGCACMLGAATVLFVSKPKMLRGVLLQGLFPLLSIVLYFFK